MLNIAGGATGTAAALLALVAGLLAPPAQGDLEVARRQLPTLGAAMLMLALPQLALGWGTWKGLRWAWTFGLAFYTAGLALNAALLVLFLAVPLMLAASLLALPLNIALLWYWTRAGVRRWFGALPGPMAPHPQGPGPPRS